MSILGKLIKGVAKYAKFIPGPIGAAARIGTTLAAGIGAVKAGTAVARMVPGVGRVASQVLQGRYGIATRTIGRIGAVAGAAATGSILYDAAGNIMRSSSKRRRINPMNFRAAKRAIRRIEGAKKLMQRLGHITVRKEKC